MAADPQQRAVERSRRRVRRALAMAGFSGWTMAFFGALSLLTSWGSLTALLIGALLVLCAWNEFHGRRELRAMNPEAPVALSRNQVFIALGICGYCVLCVMQPAALDPDIRAVLTQAGMERDAERLFDLAARITRAVYCFVIAATLIVQVGTGLFYLSRVKDVARLRRADAM